VLPVLRFQIYYSFHSHPDKNDGVCEVRVQILIKFKTQN
jgi:hypothetical protein